MNRYGNVVARSAELFAFPHALRQQRRLLYTCLSARLALLWVLSCCLCSSVLAQTSFINLGFETPNLGGNYQYSPSAAAWSFSGAGITGNGNGFTSGNAAAPQGSQVAFVQGPGSSVVQSANLAAGQYTITFSAAQRGNYQSGTQVVQVQVDSVLVGQYQPPSIGYTTYQTSTFTVASTGYHTIAFVGAGSGSDFTAFVDDVRINAVSGESPVLWFDDALPTGALTGGDGEGWTWVSGAPAPYSGTLAHQSANLAAEHQHYFWNASAMLNVATGDSLFAYVYLDPSNAPSEVMLQWNDGSWEHRAYWGANQIGWGNDGTSSRQYMGPLPTSGHWVQLLVPASAVALEGHVVNGMAFTLYGGRATFDYAGKTAAGSLQAQSITFGALSSKTLGASPFGITALASSGLPVSFSSLTTTVCTVSGGTVTIIAVGTCTMRAAQPGNASFAAAANVDQSFSVTGSQPTEVWFDDELPAGALTGGDGEGWTWVSAAPAPYSGTLAHQSANLAGEHQHYFWNASATLNVATGDALFAYVYVDPSNPPSEVMLQWNDGSWEHRAYWGANQIGWGVDGTFSRRYMGALPPSAQWVQLVVPASAVALEGHVLNGMAFTLYGGRATFDYAGKSLAAGQQAQAITFGALVNRALGSGSFAVSATASSLLPVSFVSLTTTVCTVSGGTVTIIAVGTCTIRASQAGNASYAAAANVDQSFGVTGLQSTVVWFDDALPAGALTGGDGEAWTWVSSAPAAYSGVVAHQSGSLAGEHQHYFWNASATLNVATGDSLFAYVYVDPSNPPSEVMLQWNDGSWEHRAYWGANHIGWGIDGTSSRQYMGPLPAGAQWVQLVVPASVVALEGHVLNGMAFTLYGGRATFDYAGKTVVAAAQQAQTITFGALPSKTFGAAPFGISATASSALAVSFSSLTTTVCTVSSGAVTIVAVGTCTIRASQPGNASYLAAPNIDQSFSITQSTQTISFGALANRTLGSGSFAVSATASSGLVVTFTSLTTTVCTISGTTITLLTGGTCTIRAAQPGNGTYVAASNVDQSFSITVAQLAQTIAFSPLADQFVGALPSTLWASASSGLAVSFASMTPTTCSVVANQATALSAGACTVRASQAGNGSYTAAANIDRTMNLVAGAATGPLFNRPVDYAAGLYPDAIVSRDFNGDGKLDLAVANWSEGTVSVLLGQGDGTFGPAATYAVGVGPMSIVAADFNSDGKLDLATANLLSKDVSVLLGRGDGTFATATTVNIGVALFGLAAGDLNGDGKLDLAVTNGTSNAVTGQSVYILSGNGAGAFSIAGSVPTGLNPMAVAIADVNGDGKQDLVVTNADSNTMSVLLGAGNGSFFGQVTYATSYSPQALTVGDVNGDGKLDVIVSNSWTNNVSVFVNRGDGTFLPAVNYDVGSAPGAVVIGDFNDDGKPDLAVVDELQDDIAVLTGNGNDTFQAAVFYGVLGHPLGIAVGDFNGDNKLDLAVATTASNAVSVLLRTGSAGVPATLAVSSGSPQSGAVSTEYATPLAVMVRDSVGQPLAGTLVTFAAPSTGPSGSFTSGATAQAISGATGIATAPTFTANAITGAFFVTASGGSLNALFALTNTAGANAAPAFTNAPPPNGTFNVAYNYLIKATGVPAPSFSVLPNALPPGLALSGTTGSISGTPSATGTFSGMLTATNAIPPDANQSFAITIAMATQSITFDALSDKPLGTATFAVSATASSGLMVAFSSLTSSVCTVSGATVTLVSTGTCTVRASQGGNANYAAALNVDRTFTVSSTPLLLQPSASTFNVNADELTITGAVQAPLNSSLLVGGVEAMIDATGRFFVDHVPLDATTSSVSLTLKSSDGRTTTQDVQVIATGAPTPVVLTAHPSRGVPPLDVTFRLRNNTGAAIMKIELDGFGTGTYSDTTGPFAQQGYVMIDYPLPGTYHPTVRLTDTSGKTYVQSTTVVVDRPSDWDQVFRDIWQTMNVALTAGSSPTALAYLTTAANARYTRVFTDLAGQFPGIVASYGPLLLIEITDSYATYAVTRTSGGVQKVYFIEFVKDEDGIWRIDSM